MIAATSPTPARIFEKVPAPDSSSASSMVERVGFCVAAAEVGLSGLVGGLSATVALGRETLGAPPPDPPGRGAFAVFRAMVGAPMGALEVASLIVGAPAVGGDAVRRGMVGAGTGALGAVGAPEGGSVAVGGLGTVGAGGATGGVGGLTVGAGLVGRLAEGTAGGASAALRVTRTVSFFRGTLEVCFEGVLFSFSLMRFGFFASRKSKAISFPHVKHPSPQFCAANRPSGEDPLKHPENAGEGDENGADNLDCPRPFPQRPKDQECDRENRDLGKFDPDVEAD